MLGEWYLPPGESQVISTITEGAISISHPACLSSQTRISQTPPLQADNFYGPSNHPAPRSGGLGLFRHLDQCFQSLGGYYTTLQVITLLSFMALCRIKTVEQLQYHPPGELGKLLGLDRVPEVRCLRHELTVVSTGDAPQSWAALLSGD